MFARTLAAISLLLLLLLAGCSSMTGERLEKKIAKKLEGVDRYYAELEAEVYSLEGKQSYRIKQWLQEPDKWRVEVESATASQIFICDGEQVYVYQPGIEDYYRLDVNMADTVSPPFFLAGYLEQLLNANSYTFEGEREKDGKQYYTATYSENDRDESTRLWLDSKTLFPMIVETTSSGEPLNRMICTVLDLKPDLADDLFIFDPPGEGEVTSHCLIDPLSLEEAKEDWPHTVFMPEYLPVGTFLFVISRGEEGGREQLVSIYKGENPFILVQGPTTEALPFIADATRKVVIGQMTAYYHPNSSDELSTLWWSNDSSTFILTGNLALEEMSKIASSLQPM